MNYGCKTCDTPNKPIRDKETENPPTNIKQNNGEPQSVNYLDTEHPRRQPASHWFKNSQEGDNVEEIKPCIDYHTGLKCEEATCNFSHKDMTKTERHNLIESLNTTKNLAKVEHNNQEKEKERNKHQNLNLTQQIKETNKDIRTLRLSLQTDNGIVITPESALCYSNECAHNNEAAIRMGIETLMRKVKRIHRFSSQRERPHILAALSNFKTL